MQLAGVIKIFWHLAIGEQRLELHVDYVAVNVGGAGAVGQQPLRNEAHCDILCEFTVAHMHSGQPAVQTPHIFEIRSCAYGSCRYDSIQ